MACHGWQVRPMDVRGPNKLDMDVPRPPMQPRAPGPGGLRPQEEDRRPAQAPQPRPQAKMVPKAPENIVCPGLYKVLRNSKVEPGLGRRKDASVSSGWCCGQLWPLNRASRLRKSPHFTHVIVPGPSEQSIIYLYRRSIIDVSSEARISGGDEQRAAPRHARRGGQHHSSYSSYLSLKPLQTLVQREMTETLPNGLVRMPVEPDGWVTVHVGPRRRCLGAFRRGTSTARRSWPRRSQSREP